MSQNYSFFASSSDMQQQDQSHGQQPFLDMSANGRSHASGGDQVARNSMPQMAAASGTAGINLSQFPPALVAQVLQAIQLGAIPMPPPPPSNTSSGQFIAPVSVVQQAQPDAAASTSGLQGIKKPAQQELINGYATNDRDDGVDIEREDGELEDAEARTGESGVRLNARGFLHAPPSGPRLGSKTPPGQAPQNKHDPYVRAPVLSGTQASSSNLSKPHRESESRDFILQLHKAGYTFSHLAKELGDTKPLRRMYQQLELPIPAEQTPILQTPSAAVEARKSSTKGPALPKAPAPSDRTEYLKRLAAARNKTPAKVVATSSPTALTTDSSRPTPAIPVRDDPIPSVQAGPSSKKPALKIDEATAAAKRLLLKERLEALKAKQAAKLSGTQSTGKLPAPVSTVGNQMNVAHSSSPVNASGVPVKTSSEIAGSSAAAPKAPSGISGQAQAISPTEKIVPSSTPLFTPFRGLPGLQAARLPGLPGLSGSMQPATYLPVASSAQHLVSLPAPEAAGVHASASQAPIMDSSEQAQDNVVNTKRAAGPDFEMPTTAPRRPFGASRHNSNTEHFIIHTSDDEEDEMEEDVNYLPSAGNSSNGNLSQIEANVQKLKEKIAAIELAKTSKSNGSTPVGSMVTSIDNGHGLAAQSTNSKNKLVSQSANLQGAVSSPTLSSHANKSSAESRESNPGRQHLLPAAASQPDEGLALGASPSHGLGYDTFNTVQETASSRSSPSSEDFYTTEDHHAMPSTSNGAHINLADERQSQSERITPSDLMSEQGHGSEDNSSMSQQHSSMFPTLAQHSLVSDADPASNISRGQEFDNGGSDDAIKSSMAEPDGDAADDVIVQHASNSIASQHNTVSNHASIVSDQTSDDDTNETSSASSRNSEKTDEDEYEPRGITSVASAMVAPSVNLSRNPTPPSLIDMDDTAQSPSPAHDEAAAEISELAFCPSESIGEKCDDPSCQWQHYGATALNDNELLMSLGMTRPPVNNDEEKQRWKDGLGTLIKQLRLSKMGSDVNVIAAHICDYRRKFIGDDSKIIHLGP
nr:hypothetical protein CFP56_13367 [Quercus suber]